MGFSVKGSSVLQENFIPFVWGSGDQVTPPTFNSSWTPEPPSDSYYGFDVAVGLNKIVVGAYRDHTVDGADLGAVYVYDLDGSNEIKISNTMPSKATFDDFGYSVDIGCGKIAVGSRGYDGAVAESGRVEIFDIDGTKVVELDRPTGHGFARFGQSLAIADNRVVIGAPYSDAYFTQGGAAFVYNLDGTNEIELVPSSKSSNRLYGYEVAIGHGVIAVAEIGREGTADVVGRVFLFDYSGNEIGTITGSNTAGDDFGRKISIGCGKIVVAEPSTGVGDGAAYVFDLQGNQLTTFVAAAHDVSIGNGRIIVSSGSTARIYNLDFQDLGTLSFPGTSGVGATYTSDTSFGFARTSHAIGNGKIVVGAPYAGSNQGEVFVFDTPHVYTIYDAIDLQRGNK